MALPGRHWSSSDAATFACHRPPASGRASPRLAVRRATLTSATHLRPSPRLSAGDRPAQLVMGQRPDAGWQARAGRGCLGGVNSMCTQDVNTRAVFTPAYRTRSLGTHNMWVNTLGGWLLQSAKACVPYREAETGRDAG